MFDWKKRCFRRFSLEPIPVISHLSQGAEPPRWLALLPMCALGHGQLTVPLVRGDAQGRKESYEQRAPVYVLAGNRGGYSATRRLGVVWGGMGHAAAVSRTGDEIYIEKCTKIRKI